MSYKIDVDALPTSLPHACLIIGALKEQLSHYKTLSKALQVKLSSRGSINAKEEDIIPSWLRTTELSRSQKFHLSVHFELTYEARLLSEQLKKLELSPDIFGFKIGQLYGDWRKDYHALKMEVPKNETEWIQLFMDLGINDRLEKKSLKALLSYDDVMSTEDASFKNTVKDEDKDTNKGFIFVRNISEKAKNVEIKKYIKSRGIVVHDVVHLMTDVSDGVSMRPSGIIVIFLEDVENTEFVETLPEEFRAPNEPPVIFEKILYAENQYY